MTRHDLTAGPVDRRTALAGAGVTAAALTLAAACSSNDSPSSAAPVPASPVASRAPAAPAGALVRTADVPVGGGVIVGDTVVTQPTAGAFQGYSTTCTHAGCQVNKVDNGLIMCPCHGSEYHLDGTVARGPAPRPLDSHPVRVSGDSVVRA